MNKSLALTFVFTITALLTVTTNVYAENPAQSAVNAFQVDQGATRPANNEEDVATVLLATSGSDQLTQTGADVKIAIYDLGGAEAHPLYADRLTVSAQAQRDILPHTTRMAGIIATFAPNAHINSHYNRELTPMTDGSSDIAVHSWGDVVCSRNGMYSFESALYDGYEMPLIFAAGNSGTRCDSADGFGTILSGAQSGKNIITVGSTNSNGIVSDFSSKGPTLDGRIVPTVVLPGEDVVSTCEDGTFCAASGTSYTAPAAGGIAAQLLEQYRMVYGDDAHIAPATLRALFANSAVDLGNTGPDYSYGFGQIDAVAANAQLYNTIEDSIIGGETDNKLVYVSDPSQPLRVTLAWNDIPAEMNATSALVNNLELLLIAPDGTPHHPFILDPMNPSTPATTGIDSLNTIEQVVVDNPTEGFWTVAVSGANVADQAYSVVYSDNASATTGAGVIEVPTAVSLSQLGATTTTTTALFAAFALIAIATVAVAKND